MENMLINLVLPLVVVFISLWALLYTRMQAREARKQNKLQEKEELDGRVRWEFEKLSSDHMYQLSNTGSGNAYNVKIELTKVEGHLGKMYHKVFHPGASSVYSFANEDFPISKSTFTIKWSYNPNDEPTKEFCYNPSGNIKNKFYQ